MNSIRIITISALAIMFATSVWAESQTGLVYRDLSGEISGDSTENLQRLRQAAAVKGRITVGITFSMPYEANRAKRTEDVVSTDVSLIQGLVNSVVAPLVKLNYAEVVVLPGASEDSPRCVLNVTLEGLDLLALDSDVAIISPIGE